MASPTTSTGFVLLLVAMAGLADLAAAARPADARAVALSSAAKHAMASSAGVTADGAELEGIMECMIGCFTQVMPCAFGCMGKGPDMPLCVISCNQKNIVCMIRCAITPSPPGPTPPRPTPPGPTPPGPYPKPPAPKPPGPAPGPPGPPYTGHNTETSA